MDRNDPSNFEIRNPDLDTKENSMASLTSSRGANRILTFFLALLMGVVLLGPARAGIVVRNPGDEVSTIDTDGDGVPDDVDNCSSVPNAGPLACDTDMDGYGNACDGDFNNDGSVDGGGDFLGIFLADFAKGSDASGTGTDMDCNGAVDGGSDFLTRFLSQFAVGAPGPSGLGCAGSVPCPTEGVDDELPPHEGPPPTFFHPLAHADIQLQLQQDVADGLYADMRSAVRALDLRDSSTADEVGGGSVLSRAEPVERMRFRPADDAAPALPVRETDPGLEWVLDSQLPMPSEPSIELVLSFEMPEVGRFLVSEQLDVAVAEGRVFDYESFEAERSALVEARREVGGAALHALRAQVGQWGGEIVGETPLTPAAHVRLAPPAARSIALGLEGLVRVGFPAVEQDDCDVDSSDDGGASVHGEELMGLLQTEQFYDEGEFGQGMLIGVSESRAASVFRRHPGFEDASGNDRFRNCVWPLCANGNPGTGWDHSTAVASVLLGDITRGQHASNWSAGSTGSIRRSGVARRAHGFGVNSSTSGWSYAINRLTSPSRGIDIITRSTSSDSNDPMCTGATTENRDWNAVFESGWPVFNSTGNNHHGSTADCTTASPSIAMGTFAVSQHGYDSSDAVTMNGFSSSRGGTAVEGRGRTIVDIAAPTPFRFAYPHYDRPRNASGNPIFYGADWDNDGVGAQTFGASSMATPAVAGTAAVFRRWYETNVSAAIRDPGRLYANLLLMGDRSTDSGPITSGFDNLWGAGVLRARKFNAAGMDGPARWQTGRVSVADGETVIIPLNGSSNGTIPDDVDIIKAVIWFYDDRHDDSFTQALLEGFGGPKNWNDVDLRLERLGGGLGALAWETMESSATGDNKERVFHEPTASTGWPWSKSAKWRLAIDGSRITNGSQRVHYAFLWEDSDRESGDVHACVRTEN